MAYNRWRNGYSCTVYRSIWRPTPNTELYHYGVKGMKWRQHIKRAAQAVSDATGYSAYKEYKQASANEQKAFENYQNVAGYNSWLSKDDDSKKARDKWRTAAFFKSEAYNKYKGTPMYKVQKKIEKGKQLVRDIVSAFKKFKG